jgi:hypothetical protein
LSAPRLFEALLRYVDPLRGREWAGQTVKWPGLLYLAVLLHEFLQGLVHPPAALQVARSGIDGQALLKTLQVPLREGHLVLLISSYIYL